MAQGYQLSQALYVAAELGVADALAAGPLDARALASAVGARADELARVVRALVAHGVFEQAADGRFALNDAAACLQRDAPGDTRAIVVDFGAQMYRAFGELLHSVRTGQPGFDAVYGQALFDSSTSAAGSGRSWPRCCRPTRGSRACCANGLLARLAGPYLAEQGVADRCRIDEGDFFTRVPEGGDLYLLKSVLHDWDDERCRAILTRCRAAMDPRARLVIVEIVLPDRATADPGLVPGVLLDLIMLAYAGGRERTRREFTALLDAAALALHDATPLPSGPHLIEPRPV
jgi:hypothetical protein